MIEKGGLSPPEICDVPVQVINNGTINFNIITIIHCSILLSSGNHECNLDFRKLKQKGIAMYSKSYLQNLRFYLASVLLIMGIGNLLDAQSYQLKGKTELAGSFSFQSIDNKTFSGPDWILNLPVQMRHFITQNIGVGAEVIFTERKGEGNSGLVLNGMLELAFPTADGIIPFLNAGYGTSNGSFIYDRLATKYYDGATPGVLNLGCGIRVPFGKKVFGKTEVRYQKFTGEWKYQNPFYGDQTVDIDITYVSFLFGLSLLL